MLSADITAARLTASRRVSTALPPPLVDRDALPAAIIATHSAQIQTTYAHICSNTNI